MWNEYSDIMQAMGAIPNGSVQNADHAIPDVYGKALHLYFALLKPNRTSHEQEIYLWRGLLALLALQDYLDLPLAWERVSLPQMLPNQTENLFDAALRHPPREARRVLSTDPREQWNGKDFYVLSWIDENDTPIDLLIYSPITLVCPVANWRKIFAGLERIKWFDHINGRFLKPEDVLNDQEKRIVRFWLDGISERFNLPAANEGQRMISQQLGQYIKDLNAPLSDEERLNYRFEEIAVRQAPPSDLFRDLKMTVKSTLPGENPGGGPIIVNQLFADQLCYFQADENPFAKCRHSQNYEIKSRKDCYAFLPVHARYRSHFNSLDLAQGIHMDWITQNGTDMIHVTLTIAGKNYERDYKVSEQITAASGVAVPFLAGKIDKKTVPLVAVWPGRTSGPWNKYYVMLDGSACDSGDLRVADFSEIQTGSNGYVFQTSYVPTAIPIVRTFDNAGSVCVGMITPKLETPGTPAAPLSADVAVDFGTSSTRVFAKINGKTSELDITKDLPLLVTDCDVAREILMRDYFVAPVSFSRASNTLFSVYRRSGQTPQTVQPVLDGVIYQPGRISVEEFMKDTNMLMSDLKWTTKINRDCYTAFMEQLFLHIASLLDAQGVNSIKWKYALPKNMDTDMKDTIRDIWNKKLGQYLQDTIGNSIGSTIENDLTESEAASRYFLSIPGNTAHARMGYLVVDIGGGSTDIALWQGEEQNVHMVWHTSVNVAGRKMFTRWIQAHIEELCQGTQDENITAHLDRINTMPEDLRSTLIEMLLNANYGTLLDYYRQECREHQNGWGMKLRGEINMSISSLMFALGYQIGKLINSGAFTVPAGDGAFTIAFGGRGANMLEWRGYGQPLLQSFFQEGLAAAGVQETFHVETTVSSSPKCEVAQGLLVDRPPESGPALDLPDISMDTAAFIDAAETFQTVFNGAFQSSKAAGKPLCALQPINRDMLAAQIEKNSERRIANVFMETIYNNFEFAE